MLLPSHAQRIQFCPFSQVRGLGRQRACHECNAEQLRAWAAATAAGSGAAMFVELGGEAGGWFGRAKIKEDGKLFVVIKVRFHRACYLHFPSRDGMG